MMTTSNGDKYQNYDGSICDQNDVAIVVVVDHTTTSTYIVVNNDGG